MEHELEKLGIQFWREYHQVPDWVIQVDTIYLPEYEQRVYVDSKDWDRLYELGLV